MGACEAWGTSTICLAGFWKVQGNRKTRADHYPSGSFFVSADYLRSLAQCTRTELPQIITTLNHHQYVKGTSRGDNGVATGLADRERAVCRVADTRGLPRIENYGSIRPRSHRDFVVPSAP